jgi:hypothetical protein
MTTDAASAITLACVAKLDDGYLAHRRFNNELAVAYSVLAGLLADRVLPTLR